jgi:hypothetical protein
VIRPPEIRHSYLSAVLGVFSSEVSLTNLATVVMLRAMEEEPTKIAT